MYGAVHYIVETASGLMPEQAVKTLAGLHGHGAIALLASGIAADVRQLFHDTQRVVPQGLDFDGLAAPRGHHPITDLDVHPGELDAILPGSEQAILVHANAVACTTHM